MKVGEERGYGEPVSLVPEAMFVQKLLNSGDSGGFATAAAEALSDPKRDKHLLGGSTTSQPDHRCSGRSSVGEGAVFAPDFLRQAAAYLDGEASMRNISTGRFFQPLLLVRLLVRCSSSFYHLLVGGKPTLPPL